MCIRDSYEDYKDFLTDEVREEPIQAQLERYLSKKSYNMDLVDTTVLVLCNSTSVNAEIWVREMNDLVQERVVHPSRSPAMNGTIYLLRTPDHYQSLVLDTPAGILSHCFSLYEKIY